MSGDRIGGRMDGVDPVVRFERQSLGLTRPPSIASPPMEAPKPLDPKTKASIGERLKDSMGGKILGGIGKEYGRGFSLMGSLIDPNVRSPKEASGKEIGKFAKSLAFAPFKTGVGLLLSANLLLGMILATPIIAVAKAFPKQTEFLFRSKTIDEEGIR